MSGVIKSGDRLSQSAVQPLGLRIAETQIIPLVRHDEESERLRRHIADLEQERAVLHDTIARLESDIPRAFEDGRVEGHASGMAEAQDHAAGRMALLEDALKAASAGVAEGLAAMPRLSSLLARECLDIILGDSAGNAERIAQIVSAQMSRIDRELLLSVEVSREDFVDAAALSALSATSQMPPASVIARPDLPSGRCLMNLRLGKMDVGVHQQWGQLREILGDIADQAAP